MFAFYIEIMIFWVTDKELPIAGQGWKYSVV